ncbi:MAG: hypothetical protein V3V57_10780, partial [Spirochaetia bacterium]
ARSSVARFPCGNGLFSLCHVLPGIPSTCSTVGMRIEADRKIDGVGWESREVTEAVEGNFSKLEIRNIAGPILVEGRGATCSPVISPFRSASRGETSWRGRWETVLYPLK